MTENFVPFPLGEVEVTDAYCENALTKEVAYLLSLQEGRLLAGFYQNAGISSPFVRYGGWESGLIGGHTLGHYLSALAQGSVNPSVPASDRSALKERAGRIVSALSECQNRVGTGLIWGAPILGGGIETQFDNVEQGKEDIEREAWVPWYTLHKLLAGLCDVYRRLAEPAALKVACGLGDWVAERVGRWDARTALRVLQVEYGGMNDALYTLYSFTGQEKYADAAHKFDEEALFDLILTEGKDVLNDVHANTTVPKIIGALNRYRVLHGKSLSGEKVNAERYLQVAKSFFRMAVERHAYVTGGVSEWERFGRDGILDAERTNCNCETCIAYNMMKLAQGLFCVTGERGYADYYDNAFVNSVLSSQNPETGMTTYFQPMAGGYFKVFSSPEQNFWCCTGSGMENFTKLGEGIYYRRGKSILVGRYLSSRLTGETVISQTCNFPLENRATFLIERAPEPFSLLLRVPDWAAAYPTLKRNGAEVRLLEAGGFLTLVVKEGDVVELTIPVEVRLKGLPDGKDAFAFLYGGAVLSADLGSEDMQVTTTGVQVSVPARKLLPTEEIRFDSLYDLFEEPSRFLRREGERFFLTGGDLPLEFGLHYKRYRERYAIYWRLKEKPSK